MELRFARQHLGSDGIVLLTLDYPELKINKLSDEVWAELETLADRWAQDPAIRGVVIESAKRSVFMAGADITELQDLTDPQIPDRKSATAHRVLNRIERCGKPVVAAVAGAALGGGLELVLAAHAVVVADDEKVKLGLPETKLGLIPGAGGTQRLPRRIGAEEAVKQLAKTKPHLFRTGQAGGFTQGARRDGGAEQPSVARGRELYLQRRQKRT